ncbi:MAG: CpsB/CapC family capsule biosynthesis tyrosine phosphatase [Pseudomonadota bacterium]
MWEKGKAGSEFIFRKPANVSKGLNLNRKLLDLHNHMLPGIDDGAPDWDQSLAMARQAVEDGVEGVVCTPHWVQGRYPNTRSVVLNIFQELQDRLKASRIPLRVYPGAELRFEPGVCQAILAGEVLTINDTGRFALIELSDSVLPQNLEVFLWELQVQKVTPILSHPERNPLLIRDPHRLYDWVERGVLVQVTAASMVGAFGQRVKDFATLLVTHNLAHVLATDAHGLNGRSCQLTGAYKIIEQIRGEKAAKDMVLKTPREIIEGKAVVPQDPIPFKARSARSGFLKRLFPFFLKGLVLAFLLAGCGRPTIQQIEPEAGVMVQWNKEKLRWELAAKTLEESTVQEVTPGKPEAADETLIQLDPAGPLAQDVPQGEIQGQGGHFPR